MTPGPKKKLATECVDRRNGRPVVPVPAADVADMPEGLCENAQKAWHAYWADGVSGIITPADLMLLHRWIGAVDRYCRLSAMADAAPLAKGSQGQTVVSPLFAAANSAIAIAERVEKVLGMGAKYRAALGLAVVTAEDAAAKHRERAQREATMIERVDPRTIGRD